MDELKSLKRIDEELQHGYIDDDFDLHFHADETEVLLNDLKETLEALTTLLNKTELFERRQLQPLRDRIDTLLKLVGSVLMHYAKPNKSFHLESEVVNNALAHVQKELAALITYEQQRRTRRNLIKGGAALAGAAAIGGVASWLAQGIGPGVYARFAVVERKEDALRWKEHLKKIGVEIFQSSDGKYHVLFPHAYTSVAEAERQLTGRLPVEVAIVEIDRESAVTWQKTIVPQHLVERDLKPGLYLQFGAYEDRKFADNLARKHLGLELVLHINESPKYRLILDHRCETLDEAIELQEGFTKTGLFEEIGIVEIGEDGATAWLSRIATRVITQVESISPTAPIVTSNGINLDDFVNAAIARYGNVIDRRLVAAVMKQESQFNVRARSPKNARGLMQVMPKTYYLQCVLDSKHPRFEGMSRGQRRRWAQANWEEALYDPELNIDAGVYYLSWLHTMFNGDRRKIIMGYNAGPGNVRRGKASRIAETKKYLKKVLENLE